MGSDARAANLYLTDGVGNWPDRPFPEWPFSHKAIILVPELFAFSWPFCYVVGIPGVLQCLFSCTISCRSAPLLSLFLYGDGSEF